MTRKMGLRQLKLAGTGTGVGNDSIRRELHGEFLTPDAMSLIAGPIIEYCIACVSCIVNSYLPERDRYS